MSKVLVTGGAGFIGSHIVDKLLVEGHSVRVVDNFTSGCLANLPQQEGRVEIISGDLSDPSVSEMACEDIECIFHLAAIPSVESSVRDPLKTQRSGEVATVNLLHSVARRGVRRIVFSSSSSVYGPCDTLPISELCPVAPLSPYAASKAACEACLKAFSGCYTMDAVALRYFNVFGPRQNPSSPYSGVLSIFIAKLLAKETPTIFGDGNQTRDFVFVSDVVQANLLAMKAERRFNGAAINVGTGKCSSLNEVLTALNELLGTTVTPRHAPARTGDVRHSQADISAARNLLGYSPAIGLRDGLDSCIRHQQKSELVRAV